MKLELLKTVENEVRDCTRCGLCEQRNKTAFSRGNPAARLLIIGEAPGADEDREGIPFVGAAGKMLDAIIEACGWDRNRDVYICNVVKCRPPGNRMPTPEEQSHCRSYLDEQIEVVNPEFILCLGSVASKALTGDLISTARQGESQYKGRRVFCTYHPSFLLRPPDQKAKKAAVWGDLKPLRDLLKK